MEGLEAAASVLPRVSGKSAALVFALHALGCEPTSGATSAQAEPRAVPSITADGAVQAVPAPSAAGTASTHTVTTATVTAPSAAVRPSAPLRLWLGGDVSFGREVGQRQQRDPGFAPFAKLKPWLAAADLRVVNLESVLSDQGGSTEHPHNPLVFNGPPAAAHSLRDAGIDAVSCANNHSWDFGLKGLRESLGHLRDAGVFCVGASQRYGHAYEPVLLAHGVHRIALLAFTQVWNDGELSNHVARNYVAGADYDEMRRAIRRARKEAQLVLVSLHSSNEYIPLPREKARSFARALLKAGADVVFAHHPHVVQGVEWIGGKPILYSLGNLIFDSHQERAETRRGMVARLDIELFAERAAELQQLRLCPVQLQDSLPEPLSNADQLEAFRSELIELSRPLGGLIASPPDLEGCVTVEQSPTPLPYDQRRGFRPNGPDSE